ncbi:MAG: OmpA family protein [Bacteroidetes bacterium]|nr:OmpA family protein [Bacteroidota bacterium]
MKKFLLIILSVLAVQFSYAQKQDMNSSRYSFGLALDILDQHTPDVKGYQLFDAPMDFGMRAFSWINLNSSVAIELGIGTNALRAGEISDPFNQKNLHLFNVDAGIVYKFNNGYILKESTPVAPFLFAKARGSFSDLRRSIAGGERWGFGVPIGGGLNFRVADGMIFQASAAYTFGVTSEYENDVILSMGFLFDVGEKKKMVVVEPEPEPVLDTDMDGIIDDEDNCPTVAGLVEFNGCPDTDADGIQDSSDDCPAVAGLAKYNGCPDTDGDGIADPSDDCPEVAGLERLNGCPIPDTDGDGINDENDDCPMIPGLAAFNGCPDSDGDGVMDADDRCPTEAGPASNKGCPELPEETQATLDYAAQNIQFETGSAVIKTQSFSILDNVSNILKEWTNYSASVDGHTDSVGSEESNMALSEKRAEAAAAYLISKGVEANRISSQGFGETAPKADNGTAAGRAQNRRVEFNLFIK